MKKKILTAPNFYFLLWVLYFTQGAILPTGSFLGKIVLVVFLAISLYYMFYVITRYNTNRYLKALTVLVMMFTIYGLYAIIEYGGGEMVVSTRTVNSFDYLKLIYLSLLPTYAFYVFTKKGLIDDLWLRKVFFILFGVMLIQYVLYTSLIRQNSVNGEMNTINVGYQFVSLIPMVYLFKRRTILQYILLAVLFLIVLSTFKRGAIFTGGVCVVYFIYTSLSNSKNNSKGLVIIIAVLFIFFVSNSVLRFYENSNYAQLRMEQTLEGQSSGRDEIFSDAWNIFVNSNPIQFLFGHGANGTVKEIGIAAHNDWLEILVNQGILGLFVYVFYWFAFYSVIRKNKNELTSPIIATVAIIYFVSSWFSMSYGSMHLPANICLGYCLVKQHLMQDL